jgi:uncharacterized membrane protein (DUF4010 family)
MVNRLSQHKLLVPHFEWTIEVRFLLALALGFLVGLERETSVLVQKARMFSGVRTHSLVSLTGFACGILHQQGVPWILPTGLLSIGALAAVEYAGKFRAGLTGWTSEAALLLTYLTGALAVQGDVRLPLALGIISTMLLSEKAEIEARIDRLNKTEVLAVIRFLVVTVIALPVLPDAEFTRFHLNPRQIWWIVILVSAFGFLGYLLMKRLGDRLGLELAGLLGGVVSSTAVAVASGRIAQLDPRRTRAALKATFLASSVMYLRILVLVTALNPALFSWLWWRLGLLAGAGLLLTLSIRGPTGFSDATAEKPFAALPNPFELKPALLFAGIFVLISLLTTWVKSALGSAGFLALASVVGVTDIDPFILSIVRRGAGLVEPLAITAIILAMASNTLAKGIYFSVLAKQARRTTLWRFVLWSLLHLPLVYVR